jgi:hypothetical protein
MPLIRNELQAHLLAGLPEACSHVFCGQSSLGGHSPLSVKEHIAQLFYALRLSVGPCIGAIMSIFSCFNDSSAIADARGS